MTSNAIPQKVVPFFTYIFDGVGADETIALGKANFIQGWDGVKLAGGPLFGTCTYDGERKKGYLLTGNDHVKNCYCMVCDDVGTKIMPGATLAQIIKVYKPDWILETSPGNYQVGYRIVVSGDLGPVSGLIRALIAAGLSDPGATGGNRKFKVPGGKHKSGFVALLVYWKPRTRRRTLDAIAALHGVTFTAVAARKNVAGAAVDANDPIVKWLVVNGHAQSIDGDKVHVVCPWAAGHTSAAVATEATYWPASRGFNCFHGHCSERNGRSFAQWVGGAGGPNSFRFGASVLPDLKLTANGKLAAIQRATMPNIRAALAAMQVSYGFNVMTYEPEFANMSYREILDALTMANITSRGDIDECMLEVVKERSYHPMERWILSAPWDGVSRLSALAATVKTDDDAFWAVSLRRWLLQGCEGACGWRGADTQKSSVLLLTGPQGIGKSSWFASLVPAAFFLGEQSLHLSSHDAKDSMMRALSRPVCELAELEATNSKSAVSALKGFLSAVVDVIRAPYARAADQRPRATSFCASTNPQTVLVDLTGSRRFLPNAVVSIDWTADIDIQQLWAEVHVLWASGEQWWLTPDEDAQRIERESDFQQSTQIGDLLTEVFKTDMPREDWGAYSATDIADRLGIAAPLPVVLGEISQWLERNHHKRRRQLLGVRNAWLMPWANAGSAKGHLKGVSVPPDDSLPIGD